MPVSTLITSLTPSRAAASSILALHAVAFAQPVRHMKVALPAEHLDGCLQQHHGGRPVHVVVAVDQDRLLRRNRPAGCARPRAPYPASSKDRAGAQIVDEESARPLPLDRTPRATSSSAISSGSPASRASARGRTWIISESIQRLQSNAGAASGVLTTRSSASSSSQDDVAVVLQRLQQLLVALIPRRGVLVQKHNPLVRKAQLDIPHATHMRTPATAPLRSRETPRPENSSPAALRRSSSRSSFSSTTSLMVRKAAPAAFAVSTKSFQLSAFESSSHSTVGTSSPTYSGDAPHSMACNKGHHVVFERDQTVLQHSRIYELSPARARGKIG